MKTISIVIPSYNEELNILQAYQEITKILYEKLSNYNYEILFIDNNSSDSSQLLIESLCCKDKNVKAIFNARNFGQPRSHFYGLINTTGDCAILLHADLQNPPSLIVDFVHEWENGHKIVIGVKDKSKESKIMYFLRTCYYKMMKYLSDIDHIEHFTDFELLDREFIDILVNLDEPLPYLRGIVSELGYGIKRVHYTQNRRERGKTSANFKHIYEFGMIGITSYCKFMLRIATILGFFLSGISIIVAIITLILKLTNWDKYQMGVAAIGVGVFTLEAVQLFFIGLLGEFVLSINSRVMKRPLVIESKRINLPNTREKQFGEQKNNDNPPNSGSS